MHCMRLRHSPTHPPTSWLAAPPPPPLPGLLRQVVACYCANCSSRVASGHDRPLFSFTRWERHTGSKAKKWRLSLRIEPGSVPECVPGARGLLGWALRATRLLTPPGW